jgi:hypothetical protein
MDARAGLPVAWVLHRVGKDLKWRMWLAGLKPGACTASVSIYDALASGVARETHAKLVFAAPGKF